MFCSSRTRAAACGAYRKESLAWELINFKSSAFPILTQEMKASSPQKVAVLFLDKNAVTSSFNSQLQYLLSRSIPDYYSTLKAVRTALGRKFRREFINEEQDYGP